MNFSFLRAGVFAFACSGAVLATAQSAQAACEGGAPNSILSTSEACDDGMLSVVMVARPPVMWKRVGPATAR